MPCRRRRPARSSVSGLSRKRNEDASYSKAQHMTQTQTAHQFLHPRNWKPAKGYSNGVAAEGRTVFMAGQIGWNAEQKLESRDFVAQTRQALRNIVAIVQEAG